MFLEKYLLSLFLIISTLTINAQSYSYSNAVLSEAAVNENDTSITLKWMYEAGASQYNIYRKIMARLVGGSNR